MIASKARKIAKAPKGEGMEDARHGEFGSPCLFGCTAGANRACAWLTLQAGGACSSATRNVGGRDGSTSAFGLAGNPQSQEVCQAADAKRGALQDVSYAYLVNRVMGPGLRGGAFTEEDKREYLRAWSQPGALTGGLNYYRANRVGPPTLGQDTPLDVSPAGTIAPAPTPLMVNVRTLVIWGEKDIALLPQNLDGLELFVPVSTVKRIPDGSHWVVHEKPAEVNAHIREFVR